MTLDLAETTKEFVDSLNFDVIEFVNNPKNNCINANIFNPLIRRYGIFSSVYEYKNISVADIIGVDHFKYRFHGQNILESFNMFFKKEGEGYQQRALGLLEYKSGKELLDALQKDGRSTSDMRVEELEDGTYMIVTNGLHRFTILRFHYLLDSMKKEKSEEELREIYKIPVLLEQKLDLKKTYINYLTRRVLGYISNICFDNEEDKITIYYSNDNTPTITNENDLMSVIRNSIDTLHPGMLMEFSEYYNKCNSFKVFIDENVPELSCKINTDENIGPKK